jgi:hypothetical protein
MKNIDAVNGIRFKAGAPPRPYLLWDPSAACTLRTGAHFTGVTGPEREGDHSRPSSIGVEI